MRRQKKLVQGGLYAFAFAATTAVGLVLGAMIVGSPGTEVPFDEAIARQVDSIRPAHPELTRVAKVVTRLGNAEIAGTIVTLIILTMLVARWRGSSRVDSEEAPFWMIVAIGGQLMNWGLKGMIHRERPPMAGRIVAADFYSFPSGHGTFAGVSLVLATMVMWRIWREHARTRILIGVILATTLATAVAASRVWLGVHYASDVIVGFVLGLVWAGLCHAIRFARR